MINVQLINIQVYVKNVRKCCERLRWIDIDQFCDILQKSQVRSNKSRRACMKDCIEVKEAGEVGKDYTKMCFCYTSIPLKRMSLC